MALSLLTSVWHQQTSHSALPALRLKLTATPSLQKMKSSSREFGLGQLLLKPASMAEKTLSALASKSGLTLGQPLKVDKCCVGAERSAPTQTNQNKYVSEINL
jgi:hypothetical protein